MKKKLLIIALPALMALSACGGQSAKPVEQEKQTLENVAETTVAQEEVFGDAQVAPPIRKMGVVDTQASYKVGYQIHFDEGEEGTADDKISIRFIAAINAEYSTMVWSRGLAGPSGQESLTFSDHSSAAGYPQLKSNVVYTSLSSGGTDEMVAGEGAYTGFTGFIVYSITNIPYESYKEYYLGVSLLLTPVAGDAVQTDFYAIKIKKNPAGTASDYRFTIPSNKSGFLFAGEFRGNLGIVEEDSPKRNDSDVATFTTDLNHDDNFVMVQKTSSIFKVWSGSCLQSPDENIYNDGGIITSNDETKYVFYLNGSNQIFRTRYGVETGYYIRGTAGAGWGNAEGDIGIGDEYRFVTDPDNKAILLGVELSVGDFKISDQNWSHYWGYKACKDGGSEWQPHDGATNIIGGAAGNFEEAANDGNIHCKVAGTYDIYLTNNWYVSIESLAS